MKTLPNTIKALIWTSFLLLFVVSSTCSYGNENNLTLVSKNKENQSQDWTLTSISGEKVTLSNFKKRPVILVFWATWCPYCKKLLPGIDKLHQKYAKQGLKVIGVNIREDWKPHVYWKNHDYQFDTVLAGDNIAEMYGIKGTPGLVFIAPDGNVINVAHFSDPDHPSLEKFAQYYLK